MINTGGEKVYPEEVEVALKDHPAVYDAVVVGLPDERFGQRVAAVVAPRPGSTITLEELTEYCRGRLAGLQAAAADHGGGRGAAHGRRQVRLQVGEERPRVNCAGVAYTTPPTLFPGRHRSRIN
ncbi:hypothetical protein LUX73_20380 [Actinomadura madurae]|nr:hypothetical protein [Actinomadura madurae]